jgi:hypothetical protein
MKMKRILFTILILAVLLGAVGVAYADDGRQFRARLTGAEEVPPVATNARGEAKFKVNRSETEISYELKIERATDILGAAGAHIHCAPAGSNGPVVAFLSGVITGGLDGKVEIKATLTAANITNTACGATIAELVQSMRNGNTYVNAHSPAFPTGEIRGQIRGAGGDDDGDDD